MGRVSPSASAQSIAHWVGVDGVTRRNRTESALSVNVMVFSLLLLVTARTLAVTMHNNTPTANRAAEVRTDLTTFMVKMEQYSDSSFYRQSTRQ